MREFSSDEWPLPVVKVAYLVDWLSYTVGHEVGREMAFLDHRELYVTGEALRPRPGYNRALGLSFGRLDWHSERPGQGIGVQFSGSELAGLYAAGVSHGELLEFAGRVGRVSRVDFAVDWYGPGSVVAVRELWEAGKVETNARTCQVIVKSRRGEPDQPTVYLGSSQSDKMLRVYDKGKKEGAPFDWLRVEMQMRRETAQTWVDFAVAEGLAVAGCAVIREFCRVPLEWYERALQGRGVYMPPVGRKRTGTVEWLLSVVVPLLTRELLAEKGRGERDLYDAFSSVVLNVRDKHSGEVA